MGLRLAVDFLPTTMDGPAWKLSLSWEGFTTRWGVGRMPSTLTCRAGQEDDSLPL